MRPGIGFAPPTPAADVPPAPARDDGPTGVPSVGFGLGALAMAARSWREDAPPDDAEASRPAETVARSPAAGAPPRPNANDLVALAAVLHSEAAAPKYTDEERYAIGRTVMNRAGRRRRSVYDLLAPLGREQLGADPPFSTARTPAAVDFALAERLLTEKDAPDPTHGAGAFFEPAVQDELKRRGDLYRSDPVRYAEYRRWKKYRKSADQIRASWGPMLARIGRFEFYR